ncbi:hypothetical protein NC651_015419 [Populus alba x Populus x berolinensis]|nr:hypothetical protein NC651_015419 [Populus alba x Populus x berolinensis]
MPSITIDKPDQRWALSSNKSSGFTFLVSASPGILSEPPTPTIMPSTSATVVPPPKDVSSSPYSFGSKRSSHDSKIGKKRKIRKQRVVGLKIPKVVNKRMELDLPSVDFGLRSNCCKKEGKKRMHEMPQLLRHEFDVSDSNVRNGVAYCRVAAAAAAAAVYCSSLKPPCTNNLCVLFCILSLLFCKINNKEEQDHNICQLVIYNNPLADPEDNQYFSIFTYLPSL